MLRRHVFHLFSGHNIGLGEIDFTLFHTCSSTHEESQKTEINKNTADKHSTVITLHEWKKHKLISAQ